MRCPGAMPQVPILRQGNVARYPSQKMNNAVGIADRSAQAPAELNARRPKFCLLPVGRRGS